MLVRPEVVMLDVGPIAGRSDAGEVQHPLNKGLEVRVIDDALEVALEVDHVDQIKPYEGGEQTEICLGEGASSIAHQPITMLEVSVKLVQPMEQGGDRRIVRIL